MKSAKQILGLILLSFLIFGWGESQAQTLLNSKITDGFELFQPLANGTKIGEGDDPYYQLGMPFTFKYDNQNVTQLYIYGNGFISFNTYREPSSIAVPKLYTYPMILSWYAADLVTEDGLYYQVTGIAPFRVLTIEQRKARTYGNGGGSTFDVQVKFYETSNQIKIIYGNTAGLGAENVFGWIYFTGATASNYINVQPNDPLYPSTFYYSNVNPNQSRWIINDAPFKIPKGRTYTLKVLPAMTKVNPDGKYVLTKDYIYDDEINRPYVLISREASQYNVALRYKIYGPVGDPEAQTIYTGIQSTADPLDELIDFNPQPVGNAYRVDIPAAKGIAAGTNGALDLKTNQNLIKGGLYEVTAVLEIAGFPALNQTIKTQFYIALDYDLQATTIQAPVPKFASAYRFGDHRVPMIARITNVGKYDINYMTVKADIYYDQTDQLVATKSTVWQNMSDPLSRNEYVDVILPDFDPGQIGDYYVVFKANTDTYHPDGSMTNNYFPRIGDANYIFAVAFETETAITNILSPGTQTYLYQPFRPGVRLINNGAVDVTNLGLTCTITRNNVLLYSEQVVIPSIPAGVSNIVEYYFDKLFTPTTTGTYNITFKATVNGDEIPSNNQIATTFSVVGGLSGDYTISATGIGPRNFPTIQDAVDAMYSRGVSGPTVFKFLDANYVIGYPSKPTVPAIDMSSAIPGMNATNTVKFMADQSISQRGYVKIRIQSGSGIGFNFGQSVAPDNLNAPVNKVTDANKKSWANNAGYITFDGGSLYTIQVINESTNNQFRAPFFLGNGAQNVTLRNLIITDNLPLFLGNIPLISFTASALREFNYQSNTNVTAGIYMRSIAPYDVKTGGNSYDVDTLVNKNNLITGNQISGFGYGIVDLGIGILKKPLSDFIITYYNTNNTVSKNTITNTGYAGIYAGFENNSSFKNNRIDNVQNTVNNAVGIYFGGKATKSNFGYNSTNITIDGNEISNIKAPYNAFGIIVEQNGFDFGTGAETQFFPETEDNITIVNNIVRDLNVAAPNTNIGGIALFPSRDVLLGWYNLANKPHRTDYYVTNNRISNNTIILDDINEEFIQNTGEIFGIALAQVKNTDVINNAVSVQDQLNMNNNPMSSALYYYNPMPAQSGVNVNNNVYWISGSTIDMVRFIQTNDNTSIYEIGAPREFTRLDQWQAWTGSDLTSVSNYNFLNDFTTVGNAPAKLRTKTNPVPFGSALDGRGIALDYNTIDIDANIRGFAGHRYDVGAEQFSGKPYIVDVEMLNYTDPKVYQASIGFPFDDAQYIMTEAPVEIKAQIRNNGTTMQSGIQVALNIWRESNQNRFDNGTVVLTRTITVNNLMPGEVREISFELADGIEPEFAPKPYSDFVGTPEAYTAIPANFVKMYANVTPRYQFHIKVQYDENNWNNEILQTSRFFLMRSNYQMLLSTEKWQNIDPSALPQDPNILAANLNLDSLVGGLLKIGWYRNLDLEDPRIDYDIFDRKAWERRSINYNIYKTIFWVDGHDTNLDAGFPTNSTLTTYEYDQVIGFLNSGDPQVSLKKNFFMSSQDFVRNNQGTYSSTFASYFHAVPANPNTPLKTPFNYAGHGLTGIYVGRLQDYPVTETYWEKLRSDLYPNSFPTPGLFTIKTTGVGVPRVGMIYDTVWFDTQLYSSFKAVPENLKIGTITTNAVEYNLALLGVDWRHWGNIETVLRTVIDFAEANEGYVVPIDLLSFNAEQINNSVNLSWATSSEINSSRFDVERANGDTYTKSFIKIGEEIARGSAAEVTHYGPFVDKNIVLGNTYTYRLKMIDKSGEFKYSDEKVVTVLNGDANVSMTEVEPNPVSNVSSFEINLAASAEVSILVYDMAGTLVNTLHAGSMNAGNNVIEINAGNFSSGVYNVYINIDGKSYMKKINVVK